MGDIYDILAKHFLKEASILEEKQVFDFKQSNPKEYQMLHQLWRRGEIELHDFDSSKAWSEFRRKIKRKPENIIQLYWNIRNVAATIAFLVITTLAVIYIYNGFQFSDKIFSDNLSQNPKQIELWDESIIWLNANSSISYSEEFIKDTRVVELIGEAFFEVKKDISHPFIVTTNNSKITVLGTSFNINSSKETSEISVKNGKVRVESELLNKYIILLPNQSAIVTKKGITSSETKNKNYLSWMTGIFEFKNTPIERVIEDLNTYYHNRIELDKSRQYYCNLTAKFENNEIEQIIEIIETTCNLSSEELKNKIIIR